MLQEQQIKQCSVEGWLEILTFWETREWTSWGRMSSLTTASARSSLWSARRPRAKAAVCWMLGTTSSIRGRSKDITPAGEDTLELAAEAKYFFCTIVICVSFFEILYLQLGEWNKPDWLIQIAQNNVDQLGRRCPSCPLLDPSLFPKWSRFTLIHIWMRLQSVEVYVPWENSSH